MSKPIVEMEGVGKRYQLGVPGDRYLTLRESIAHAFRRTRTKARPSASDFWALRGIECVIQEGETLGIIGLNGAGKSTLLKILSQITPPTEGRIVVRGRTASLLEVGTGFHPELTGRENIYLNGAILGMTRKEIGNKFDEIVAFADIGPFVNTPVKRYSSGMYVRLAFAVAAHLEPEILVVDEVLSVGDSVFQQKCLGKMDEVASGGRTVLFVSHNMGAVSQLCQRVLVLRKGRLDFIGPTSEAIGHYLRCHVGQSGSVMLNERIDQGCHASSGARILKVQLQAADAAPKDTYFIGDSLTLRITAEFTRPFRALNLSFIVKSSNGGNIYHCVSRDAAFQPAAPVGIARYGATFPKLGLYPGTYVIDHLWLATADNQTLDEARDVVSFRILEGGPSVYRSLALHAAVVHEVPSWSGPESTDDSALP